MLGTHFTSNLISAFALLFFRQYLLLCYPGKTLEFAILLLQPPRQLDLRACIFRTLKFTRTFKNSPIKTFPFCSGPQVAALTQSSALACESFLSITFPEQMLSRDHRSLEVPLMLLKMFSLGGLYPGALCQEKLSCGLRFIYNSHTLRMCASSSACFLSST